ncbi:CRISPR-associated protein Cas5 [Clostridium sp. ZBS2]|uniref:CRISPR-associated protein Cas5 n=1 Tax=Clostridium sp. ZBS2 TaxID=2949976 RepID=UPI0020793727|nr:CRISPR-associated protein Cas5 [Clostridium sp. ZBS2]
MNVIRFRIEGIFNSFRIPFFRTYHKTFLAPPKTTIVGMITNIMRKSEAYYYELLNEEKIQLSVVIDSIQGKAKDLWSYKTLENKSGMHGRSIIRRDKLFKAKYTIYLKIKDDELSNKIYNALLEPKCIPSLGLDEEIVKIYDIEKNLQLNINKSNFINSVFMDKGYYYEVKIKNIQENMEMPTANIVPLKYEVKFDENYRTVRKNKDEYKQVEYINCFVELKETESYECDHNKIVFY